MFKQLTLTKFTKQILTIKFSCVQSWKLLQRKTYIEHKELEMLEIVNVVIVRGCKKLAIEIIFVKYKIKNSNSIPGLSFF